MAQIAHIERCALRWGRSARLGGGRAQQRGSELPSWREAMGQEDSLKVTSPDFTSEWAKMERSDLESHMLSAENKGIPFLAKPKSREDDSTQCRKQQEIRQ